MADYPNAKMMLAPTVFGLQQLSSLLYSPAKQTWYAAWGTGGPALVVGVGNMPVENAYLYQLALEEERENRKVVKITDNDVNFLLSFDLTISSSMVGLVLDEIGIWDSKRGGKLLFYGFPQKSGTYPATPFVLGDTYTFTETIYPTDGAF
jgi:hypothetical protein